MRCYALSTPLILGLAGCALSIPINPPVPAVGRDSAETEAPEVQVVAVEQRAASDQQDVGQLRQQSVGMMGMQMVFFGGNKFDLWFKSFNVNGAGELAASCIGLGILAVLYEGLKVGRIMLTSRMSTSGGFFSLHHWVQAFLHLVQVTVSYFLMLAVMTYSSWLFVSVCLGAALGYLLFARLVPTCALLGGNSEHCH